MQLTRRAALQGILLSSMLRPIAARARPAACEPKLLLVFLRGGLDCVAAIPPFGDPELLTLREAQALVNEEGATETLKLDGFFALHPALAPLLPYFNAGELLIVPGTAIAGVERSHAASEFALFGSDFDGLTGWPRLASLALGTEPWRIGPADRSIDLISDLAWGNPLLDLALLSPEQAQVGGSKCVEDPLAQRSLCQAARFTCAATRAAQVLATEGGPRIATLELPGFDTHISQGVRLARALKALADGLVSFAEASGTAWNRTVVLVVTEFGRAVPFNADGGTDHGTASVTFLMGGAVAGGRVGNQWPGLAPSQLRGGTDLAATTDLRAIIKAALIEHLRLPDRTVAKVFPSAAELPASIGLFRDAG